MKFDNIGVKVRALRKERGLTQEKLAEMAEISINYLSKIENNRIKNVGVLITFRLAKALGVTSGYLMGQEDMNELLDEEILGRLAECSPYGNPHHLLNGTGNRHTSDSNISAVMLKRRVKCNIQQSIRGLHDKGTKSESETGNNDSFVKPHIRLFQS